MEEKKYTHEEILAALVLIKEVCRKQQTCKNCPICDRFGTCHLDDEISPCNWELNLPDTVWCAFR